MAPHLRMWVPDWLVLSRRATYPPPWVDLVIILQDSSLLSLYTLYRTVLSTPTSSRGAGWGGVDLTLWFRVFLSSWFLKHDLELTRLGFLPERYLHHFPATRPASY